MPRPTSDAATVFKEAKKLVAEVQRSRQRSPLKLADRTINADASWNALGPKQTSRKPYVEPSEIPLSSNPWVSSLARTNDISQQNLSTTCAIGTATGYYKSPVPATEHNHATFGANRHCAPPDASANAPTSARGDDHGTLSPLLSTSPVNLPGCSNPDTDTTGDDQPSRWQLLVRRINGTPTEPGATSVSPSPVKQHARHGAGTRRVQDASPEASLYLVGSPLLASQTVDRAQPPVSSIAATSPAAPSSGTTLPYGRDQREKALRLSPQAIGGPSARAAVVVPPRVQASVYGTQAPYSGTMPSSAALAQTGPSPYERAVAALQQAEQQLRGQQRAGGSAVATAPGAAASPATEALAAAQRFLAAPRRTTADSPPRGVYRVAAGAVSERGAGSGGRGGGEVAMMATTAVDAGQGTFEEAAMGMLRRLTASAAATLPYVPTVQTYATLAPPSAEHVAAAAALAAASAAVAARAASTTECMTADTARGLDMQVAMQGLMAAARQASSEEALRADQERRRVAAEAAAEAAVVAAEDWSVHALRRGVYLRLWGLAARWSRQEGMAARGELQQRRLRRCLAAWRVTARAARAERLAAEALELAEVVRREQVAFQFRQLWLLHASLTAWRRAAMASAGERRQQQLADGVSERERQATALREAAADRFRRLWLLHAHLRAWRAAAHAQAGARAAAAAAPSREQHRRTAVNALLERLKRQREEFRLTGWPQAQGADGGGGSGGGRAAAASSASGPTVPPCATAIAPGSNRPRLHYDNDGCSAAEDAAVSSLLAHPRPQPPPAATTRPFPGLNKWIRADVMRGRSAASGPNRSPPGGSGSGCGPHGLNGPMGCAPRVHSARSTTKPVPFALSTSARARNRRDKVLAACEGTRQLVCSGWPSAGRECSGGSGAVEVVGTYGGGGGGMHMEATPVGAPRCYQQQCYQQLSRDGAMIGRGSSGGSVRACGEVAEEEADRCGESDCRRRGRSSSARCAASSPHHDDEDGGDISDADVNFGRGMEEGGMEGGAGSAAGGTSEPPPLAKEASVVPYSCSMTASYSSDGEQRGSGRSSVVLLRRDSDADGGNSPVASSSAYAPSAAPAAAASLRLSTASKVDRPPLQSQPQYGTEMQSAYDDVRASTASLTSSHSQPLPQHHRQHYQPPPPQAYHPPQHPDHHPGQVHPRSAPRTGRRDPGTWRPPSPPPPPAAATSRPCTASTHPAGRLAAAAVRQTASGRLRPTTGTNSNAILPSAGGLVVSGASMSGGGMAGGSSASSFTAADLERLRMAEVRRRRAADEAARRLAAELSAHMAALAAAHHRRALLSWYGLRPWLQLLDAARRNLQLAAEHHRAGLLSRGVRGLAMCVVRSRMRRVARQAAAVAVGRQHRRERHTRTAFRLLARWSSAARLHRRHLAGRVLLGLIRAAAEGWAAWADAAEHHYHRRLWSCFRAWRGAAEQQASETLLGELQMQHRVEAALGRSRAARVLAGWRAAAAEGAAQRAVLQQRSQQWAKVQGWLAEVQAARGRGGGVTQAVGMAAAGVDITAAPSTSTSSCAQAVAAAVGGKVSYSAGGEVDVAGSLECSLSLEGLLVRDEPRGTTSEGGGVRAAGKYNSDDPLGLGPLEEHLQEYSLGPSSLAGQAPGGRRGDPRVGRRTAWDLTSGVGGGSNLSPEAPDPASVATVGRVAASDAGLGAPLGRSERWADRREAGGGGGQVGLPPRLWPRGASGPPPLPSRQDRLARYLEGRVVRGGGPEGEEGGALGRS